MSDNLDQWRIRILRDAVRFLEAEIKQPVGDSSQDTMLRVCRAVLRRTADGYEGELEEGRTNDRMPPVGAMSQEGG